MVGPLFTVNAINVARAAVREAERELPQDAPVDIRVASHDPHGSERLVVSVTSRDGPANTIDVDDSAVRACLAKDDPAAAYRMVSDLVGELAGEIAAAVREVIRNTEPASASPTQSSAAAAAAVALRPFPPEAIRAGAEAAAAIAVER